MYPLPVTNYYFEDENSEPVSFHVLPVQWGSDTCPPPPHEKKARRIHLRGEADSCLEKVYKPVFAWRVDILCVKPVISVLSEKDTWIVLQRPRKSFESTTEFHFSKGHNVERTRRAKYKTGDSDEDLEKRIMKGESFTCPIHKCDSCKELEADTKDRDLQFAVCRRCPTSYHRKCLPRDIQFAKAKNEKDTDKSLGRSII